MTVLDRWGDHKHDVTFILRRSGTSDHSTKSRNDDSSKFDKNQQTRQSLPITSGQNKLRRTGNNGINTDRNEKIRKSLGPGIRHRQESNSSLPNNINQPNRQSGFFNTRSRSPQRRGISPSRVPRSYHNTTTLLYI